MNHNRLALSPDPLPLHPAARAGQSTVCRSRGLDSVSLGSRTVHNLSVER